MIPPLSKKRNKKNEDVNIAKTKICLLSQIRNIKYVYFMSIYLQPNTRAAYIIFTNSSFYIQYEQTAAVTISESLLS